MNWMKPKTTDPSQPQAASPAQTPTAGRIPTGGQINIGSSMHIKGELTGSEDVTIDGRVEGKIFLNDHQLTVGKNGLITAEIRDARSVVVHGEVQGNITATDRVEVSDTGTMKGDIRAPRVVLADGARFRGRIDMDPKAAAASKPKETSVESAKPARERTEPAGAKAAPAAG